MNPVALIAVLLFSIVYLVVGLGAAFMYYVDYYRKDKPFWVRVGVILFTCLYVVFWGVLFWIPIDKIWFDE